MERFFSAKDLAQILFVFDFVKKVHRNNFMHPVSSVLILLLETNYGDKDDVMTLLLHDLPEEDDFFGNLDDWQEFKLLAKKRLKKIANKTTAKLVLTLTKPIPDKKVFNSKEAAFNFYLRRLKDDPRAMLLKMVDRLEKLRGFIPLDDQVVNVIAQDKEKMICKTKTFWLPVFTEFVNKLKEQDQSRYLLPATILLQKIEFDLGRVEKNIVVSPAT